MNLTLAHRGVQIHATDEDRPNRSALLPPPMQVSVRVPNASILLEREEALIVHKLLGIALSSTASLPWVMAKDGGA